MIFQISYGTFSTEICAKMLYTIMYHRKAPACIGPMHKEKILGNTPTNTTCLVLVFILKVGIPPLKINIFQRFKIPLELR